MDDTVIVFTTVQSCALGLERGCPVKQQFIHIIQKEALDQPYVSVLEFKEKNM